MGKFCRKETFCCLLCLLSHPSAHFRAEDDLEFMILLPPSPKCSDDRPVPLPIPSLRNLFSILVDYEIGCFLFLVFVFVCFSFVFPVLCLGILQNTFWETWAGELRLLWYPVSRHQSLEPEGIQIRGVRH